MVDGPKAAIQVEQIRFTNAIRHRADGSLYMDYPADSSPRYTGGDLDGVDKTWDALLYGRYSALTNEEIDWLQESISGVNDTLVPLQAQGHGSDGPESVYGGPDMLHSLHCLNGLRRHVNPERYGEHLPVEYRQMHIDHCVEQLRQAILCHGDMMPVTIKPVWAEGLGRMVMLGQTEHPHTCRNGLGLKEWWWERGAETGRLP